MYSFTSYLFSEVFERTLILSQPYWRMNFLCNNFFFFKQPSISFKVSFHFIPFPFLELFLVTLLLFFLHFWCSQFLTGIISSLTEELPLEILVKRVCWLQIHQRFSSFEKVFLLPSFLEDILKDRELWIDNFYLLAFLWASIDALLVTKVYCLFRLPLFLRSILFLFLHPFQDITSYLVVLSP